MSYWWISLVLFLVAYLYGRDEFFGGLLVTLAIFLLLGALRLDSAPYESMWAFSIFALIQFSILMLGAFLGARAGGIVEGRDACS